MRESLTILAIAVILVLSALLVGPYFVDWSGQRQWLAAKLSKAVGAEIRIDGPIDVKLLPRPIFRAGNVSIGSSKPHDPRLSAERLDAELSINGLLQGAVEFVDARLSGPRLELTIRPDGSLFASPLVVENPQKFQFHKLAIDDGTLAVLDEAGAEKLVLHGISADGEAETLFGPLKLAGSGAGPQGRVMFRLSTGAYANRKLRARLVLDQKGDWTHFEAEGQVALAPAGPAASQQAGVSYVGSLNMSGALRIADATSPVPWSLAAATIQADPQAIAAPSIELRAGRDGRALVANGGALFSFGPKPTGAVKLHARQLDLDNVAVPPEVAPDTPRPSAAQWVAAARRLLERPALPAVDWTAETDIDAITTGDLTLTDATARLHAQPGQPSRLAVSIAGPDGTHAALDGTVDAGAAPAFKGQADFATRNLGTVSAWVDPFWPGASDWINHGLGGRSGAFAGVIDVSAVGVSARGATLSLGGTTLSGTLSLTTAAGDERARLFADLSADVLDGDQWPDLRQLAALADPLDLSIALRTDTVRLARSDAGVSETGRVSMHLTKKDRVFALDQFAISGIEGTMVSGSASLDADRRLRANGRAVAKNPVPLANVMRRVMPGVIADAFATRAAALAPLDVGFDAEATLDDRGAVAPTKLSASGTAGQTRFSGAVAPALKGGDTSDIEVNLALDAPDAIQVLQQAGWHASGQFGALHAEVRAHGDPSTALETNVAATLPGAKLAFDGRIGQATGQGRFAAGGDDVTPWLRLVGIDRTPAERAWTAAADLSWMDDAAAAAKLTAHIGGSTVTGDMAYARPAAEGGAAATLSGKLAIDALALPTLTAVGLGQPRTTVSSAPQVWSGQPFGPSPTLMSADVGIRIGSLDLWPGITARDAAMQLTLRSGILTLADAGGHVLGGTAGGTLTFRRNGPAASLTGRVALEGISVHLPSLVGRLSGTLDIAGTGTTPAAVIGSLGGDGTLKLTEATLPRLDPGALGRVASDFSGDDASIEDAPVRAALEKALDRGALPLGSVDAPATVAAGSLRVAIPRTVLPDASVTGDVAFDFETLVLTLKTAVVAAELPREWKGDPPQLTVTWKGPLDAPGRDLDPGAFVNGLAARAIAREQERIELMKDDLRERAFFARRLKQIEAEQQAARDAAQIQKMVPQPPRPGDIRLPKPPEVVAPVIPLAPKAPDTGENQDGISKFLNALTPGPKTKPVSARPLELSPGAHPAAQAAPAAPTQDPGQEGRY